MKQPASGYIPTLRPGWLAAAILACLCVIAGLTIHSLVSGRIDRFHQQYGQALSNLLAHRAVDAMLDNDLVSLQAILEEMVENRRIANAAVRDVENNLLVQSGPSIGAGSSAGTSFTAPITAHNNVAGYVTLHLASTGAGGFTRQLAALFAFLALAIGALMLWLAPGAFRARAAGDDQHSTPSARDALPIVADPAPENRDNGDTAPVTGNLPTFNVELVIQFKNLRRLHAQLNSTVFQDICRRIETRLKGVMTLYSGRLLQVNVDQAQVLFSGTDPSQAAFNAVCGAWLMSQLNRESASVQLQVSYGLAPREKDNAILKHLAFNLFQRDDWQHLLSDADDGAVLLDSGLMAESDSLGERIETHPFEDDDQLEQLAAMREPYLSLLEKQLVQLKSY